MARPTLTFYRPASLILPIVAFVAAGCSQPARTGSPFVVDPARSAPDSGGTDDIYVAVEQAIGALSLSKRVAAHEGRRIVLNRIVNRTGMPGYDERIIYNKFLSNLVERGGDRYVFLNRDAVAAERAKQQAGAVANTGIDSVPVGADMVLELELRQLPGVDTQTIQYNFSLTKLNGEFLWTKAVEIKKRR